MKLSLVFSFTLTLALSAFSLPYNQSEEEEWNAYKLKYGKHYTTKEEDKLRKNIYFDNKLKVVKHNDLYDNGLKTYKLGINKFSDLTASEFRKFKNGYKPAKKLIGEVYAPPTNVSLPSSVDWRQKGAVTPVKNQGKECGSCWAFSATGAIEGQHFLKTGKLVSLSEQNLMDCSAGEGNYSCGGGLVDYAFEYVKRNSGIDTEASYPYIGKDSSCRFKKVNIGATITGYKDIQSGSESALQSAVANIGPISVAINAISYNFEQYSSGIFYEKVCNTVNINHAVLVVGYGTENGEDYWIVKNTYGEDWVMDGYIKMARNKQNSCGIATQASYPLV